MPRQPCGPRPGAPPARWFSRPGAPAALRPAPWLKQTPADFDMKFMPMPSLPGDKLPFEAI
ncbi:hypothetical protein ACWD4F_24745, partial [Streptomyces aureus]